MCWLSRFRHESFNSSARTRHDTADAACLPRLQGIRFVSTLSYPSTCPAVDHFCCVLDVFVWLILDLMCSWSCRRGNWWERQVPSMQRTESCARQENVGSTCGEGDATWAEDHLPGRSRWGGMISSSYPSCISDFLMAWLFGHQSLLLAHERFAQNVEECILNVSPLIADLMLECKLFLFCASLV